MKLLKILASVTVCVAFDSGVESFSGVHPDSRSIRKGRALSDGSMRLNGKAEDGKRDMADEERNAKEILASVGNYFRRPAAKEDAGLSETLSPLGRNEDDFATNSKLVDDLFKKVKRGHKKKGPQLMELVVKMQNVEESKKFADTTMVEMLKHPKTKSLVVKKWIDSGKTPAETSKFLLQHVKGQNWIDFVNSDMFNPWLTFLKRLYKNKQEGLDLSERRALAKTVQEVFHNGRNWDEISAADAKLKKTKDGKFVAEIIEFA